MTVTDSDYFTDGERRALAMENRGPIRYDADGNVLHGSYANTSADRRITVNFGFHRYASVIDQHGSLSGQGNFYDEDYVRQRCRCIPLAIDARAKRFPDEDRYVYRPFAGTEDDVADTPDNRAMVLTDYAVRDLAI